MNERQADRKLIHIELKEEDFQTICGRYHYEDTDLALLKQVYEKYLRQNTVMAWVRTDYEASGDAAVLMTLGEEPDEAQNRLMEEGRLTEAYMLECLAMAVLECAYGQMDELLREETGLWCVEYCFPGGDGSLEGVSDIVRVMEQETVYCNEAGVLVPKKSVAYVAVLRKERKNDGCAVRVCAGCERRDCPNRAEEKSLPLNYGYRRIFGNQIAGTGRVHERKRNNE